MYFDFRHVIMSGSYNTGNPNINIDHYCHWYKERAHCRKNNISFVLIISTFVVLLFTPMIVPEMAMMAMVKFNKLVYKEQHHQQTTITKKKKFQFPHIADYGNIIFFSASAAPFDSFSSFFFFSRLFLPSRRDFPTHFLTLNIRGKTVKKVCFAH